MLGLGPSLTKISVLRRSSAPAFTPASLNPTAWFSAMTASSLFTDTGGTTLVTQPTDLIARANDLGAGGRNATQATAGSRPTYSRVPVGGRRNQLTQTENFNSGDWETLSAPTRTSGFSGPNSQPATLVVPRAVSGQHALRRRNIGNVLAVQIKAKASGYNFISLSQAGLATGTVVFNLSTGSVSSSGINTSGSNITNLGSGWYLCEVVLPSTNDLRFFISPTGSFDAAFTGDGVSGILICDPQAETGSSVTPYQKVVTARDVTQSGVADVFYMFDDGGDSLNWTAPAGTYTIGYVNSLGAVTILTGQALSGSADVTIPSDLVEYVAVDRALTGGETTSLTNYLQARANPL